MKRMISVAAAAGVMLVGSNALAGKVSMPREGSYEFTFCVADQAAK